MPPPLDPLVRRPPPEVLRQHRPRGQRPHEGHPRRRGLRLRVEQAVAQRGQLGVLARIQEGLHVLEGKGKVDSFLIEDEG